jgi:hypothetical protein
MAEAANRQGDAPEADGRERDGHARAVRQASVEERSIFMNVVLHGAGDVLGGSEKVLSRDADAVEESEGAVLLDEDPVRDR